MQHSLHTRQQIAVDTAMQELHRDVLPAKMAAAEEVLLANPDQLELGHEGLLTS